jgi:hypothetical protein
MNQQQLLALAWHFILIYAEDAARNPHKLYLELQVARAYKEESQLGL